MSVLRDRGVTPTQYLERFGGFGKTKDIGFIVWQVALCMNHMQEENYPAAKDALSLLFVCLEQTAMDNGKMDVGLLLALVEDPPHSLFSGRSLAVAANPRPFAPTASQKWVTVALHPVRSTSEVAEPPRTPMRESSSKAHLLGSSSPETLCPQPRRLFPNAFMIAGTEEAEKEPSSLFCGNSKMSGAAPGRLVWECENRPLSSVSTCAALPPLQAQVRKIFVGGIPQQMTQEDLVVFFSTFGPVSKAWLQRQRSDGGASANGHNQVSNHRGFGFVVFQDPNTVDELLGAEGSCFLELKEGRQLPQWCAPQVGSNLDSKASWSLAGQAIPQPCGTFLEHGALAGSAEKMPALPYQLQLPLQGQPLTFNEQMASLHELIARSRNLTQEEGLKVARVLQAAMPDHYDE
eukprot:g23439.t1